MEYIILQRQLSLEGKSISQKQSRYTDALKLLNLCQCVMLGADGALQLFLIATRYLLRRLIPRSDRINQLNLDLS